MDKLYAPALLSLRKNNTRGKNADSTMLENRNLVLRIIKDGDPVSRSALVQKTGLRNATITLIVNEFLDKGLIARRGLVEGENGRRVMGFGIKGGAFCVAAVRVNISYIAMALYDINMKPVAVTKKFMDTCSDLPRTCTVIAEELAQLRAHACGRQLLGVGVGIEGAFCLEQGLYVMLSGGQTFQVGQRLHELLGMPVFVNRATNFNTYWSWRQSGLDEVGAVVTVVVSYTLECGVMINGEILNGAQGLSGKIGRALSSAGEPLDDVATTGALLLRVTQLARRYPHSALAKKQEVNVRDVIAAFNGDDPLAVAVCTELAAHLGRIVSSIVSFLNPDIIYLCDEIPQTERFRQMVYDEAIGRMQPGAELVLATQMKERLTKLDPCLLGAAQYVGDVCLEDLHAGAEV